MTETTERATGTEKVSLPVLHDTTWTAQQMRDHITDYHTTGYIFNFGKMSKIDLVSMHDSLHGAKGRTAQFRILHDHALLDEKARKVGNEIAVSSGEKLSASDRKALERLVDYDFASVRAEIDQMAADVLAERLKSVEEEFGEKAKARQRLIDKVRKIEDAFHTGVRALLDEARTQGFTVSNMPEVRGRSYGAGEPTVTFAAQTEAESKVRREVAADCAAALRVLERKRLACQRSILLAGLGGSAKDVLDQIPTAAELMQQAVAEKSVKQLST